MKRLLSILALSVLVAACGGSASKEMADARRHIGTKCERCPAPVFPGADTFTTKTCTAKSFCKDNNRSLLSLVANTQCSAGSEECTGDCPKNSSCAGVYDRAKSKGLKVAAKKVDGNCPGAQVMCEATVTVPAGGQLACKCSCNPNRR